MWQSYFLFYLALLIQVQGSIDNALNLRTRSIQLVEEVFNRKNVAALDKFYTEDAVYRNNIFNSDARDNIGTRDIRGLNRIRDLQLRCPLFQMLGSVYTIEDSVVDMQSNTIRYVLSVHKASLNQYNHDLLRLSVLHRFNNQGLIVLTEVYGDATAFIAKLHRNAIPEYEINQMKAQRLFEIMNSNQNYESLTDLMSDNVKIFTPEQKLQGKGPMSWDEAIQQFKAYDKCFSPQDSNSEVKYVMHEQSRPDRIALVWEFNGKFNSQCPAPYEGLKPTGKSISVCGVSEYQFNRETGQITTIRTTYDIGDVIRQMKGGEPSEVSKSCSSSSQKDTGDYDIYSM